MDSLVRVSVDVNGRRYEREVEPRLLLSDFLRHELGLTGTHVGCEHGVCGACTVLLDGEPVRACLHVRGAGRRARAARRSKGCAARRRRTARSHPLQEAFREAHGLQCGFCTPGILMTPGAVPRASTRSRREAEIRERSPATSAAAPATRTSSTPSTAGRVAA